MNQKTAKLLRKSDIRQNMTKMDHRQVRKAYRGMSEEYRAKTRADLKFMLKLRAEKCTPT